MRSLPLFKFHNFAFRYGVFIIIPTDVVFGISFFVNEVTVEEYENFLQSFRTCASGSKPKFDNIRHSFTV